MKTVDELTREYEELQREIQALTLELTPPATPSGSPWLFAWGLCAVLSLVGLVLWFGSPVGRVPWHLEDVTVYYTEPTHHPPLPTMLGTTVDWCLGAQCTNWTRHPHPNVLITMPSDDGLGGDPKMVPLRIPIPRCVDAPCGVTLRVKITAVSSSGIPGVPTITEYPL